MFLCKYYFSYVHIFPQSWESMLRRRRCGRLTSEKCSCCSNYSNFPLLGCLASSITKVELFTDLCERGWPHERNESRSCQRNRVWYPPALTYWQPMGIQPAGCASSFRTHVSSNKSRAHSFERRRLMAPGGGLLSLILGALQAASGLPILLGASLR
ncbi:hypothetical protein BOTBODRAFT_452026 [Botryobasidium botryosum FD-172 SS1]|uniref:Uncharacterized protein n=1 Tax=Botryobasidium botryosum (strain FD-172 SS1) TaxID=930990 RepID=A0A067MIZ2_BOTB1|nr:hypothetical protein BOTBODRAFT_452026 [Botryobasidium botryosum FD-172 SS1]